MTVRRDAMKLRIYGGTLSALMLGAMSAVQAQTTTTEAAPTATAQTPADQPETGGLEEIVVTARKQSENILTVPISITALTSAALEERGITDYLGLQEFSPGFKYINQSVNRNDRGFTSFLIRGMNPGTPVSYRTDVGIFVDGAPIAGSVVDDFFDVERVEVLRGPQTAYFGRSTFAGAVNFITKDPSFDYKAEIEASYESWDTWHLDGSAEGTVIPDKLAFRVSESGYRTSGQYSDPQEPGVRLGERETDSGSLALKATPTDNLTINFFGRYWSDNDGPAATAYIYPSQFNCNPMGGKTPNYVCGTLPNFQYNALSYNTDYGPYILSVLNGQTPYPGIPGQSGLENAATNLIFNHYGVERIGVAAHLFGHYDFESGYSIDANLAHDSNTWGFLADLSTQNLLHTVNPIYGTPGAPPGILPYLNSVARGDTPDVDNSVEVRISSPKDSPLKWFIGGSYYQQRTGLSTGVFTTIGALQVTNLSQDNADTWGVFGNISYDILDNLNLSLEARGQWDDIRSVVDVTGQSFEQTYPSFSPRALLSYKPWEDITLYTSFSRGYRPGEFNSLFASLPAAYQAEIRAQAPVQLAIPQEKVDMYEIGIKARFFDNTLQIIADAYYGDWSNRHIQDKVYYNNIGDTAILNTLFTIPGGHTLLDGVEIETEYQVTPQLFLQATYDIANTDVRSDYCTDCLAIDGNPYPFGTRLPGYAKYSGTFSATYEMPIYDDWVGFVRADYIYTGNIFVDDANIAGTGASSKVNVHFGVDNGDYRFELFGTNILNDKTYTYAQRYTYSFGGGVNEISVSPADKPSYGARVKAKFGAAEAEPAEAAAYSPPPPQPVAPAPAMVRSYMVFFDFNRSDLTPQAIAIVDQAAANAAPAKATQLVVTGHTDTVGSDAYNMRLSRRRAESVAAELEKQGIPSGEIEIIAKGKHDLLIPTGDGVREPQNRRVQIVYNGGQTS